MYERARVRAVKGGAGWIVTHKNSSTWRETWHQAIRIANLWAQRGEDACAMRGH